jgi:hypothetical protein
MLNNFVTKEPTLFVIKSGGDSFPEQKQNVGSEGIEGYSRVGNKTAENTGQGMISARNRRTRPAIRERLKMAGWTYGMPLWGCS